MQETSAWGTVKSYVSFAEYPLFYRSLLQKRPIILSILLTKTCLEHLSPHCVAGEYLLYESHDSRMWDMTHSCEKWPIHMRHDSCIKIQNIVTWLIYMVTWLIVTWLVYIATWLLYTVTWLKHLLQRCVAPEYLMYTHVFVCREHECILSEVHICKCMLLLMCIIYIHI